MTNTEQLRAATQESNEAIAELEGVQIPYGTALKLVAARKQGIAASRSHPSRLTRKS